MFFNPDVDYRLTCWIKLSVHVTTFPEAEINVLRWSFFRFLFACRWSSLEVFETLCRRSGLEYPKNRVKRSLFGATTPLFIQLRVLIEAEGSAPPRYYNFNCIINKIRRCPYLWRTTETRECRIDQKKILYRPICNLFFFSLICSTRIIFHPNFQQIYQMGRFIK